MTGLRVGHGAVRLDVALGCELAGYLARSGVVSGELHPLEVGAVAIAGDDGPAVLVVADLLQVDDDVAGDARLAVAAATGTAADLVWLTATHTHAGPVPDRVREQTLTAAAHPEQPEYEVLVSRVAPGQPERALAVARG